MTDNESEGTSLLSLTGAIVSAYLRKNSVPANGVSDVIENVHATLKELVAGTASGAGTSQKPAVPVSKSIRPDHIVCLEDGKKLKILKRYLRTHYGLSVEAYRLKWNLPANYPMVAPEYTARRSALAKKIGLGRKPRAVNKRRKRG